MQNDKIKEELSLLKSFISITLLSIIALICFVYKKIVYNELFTFKNNKALVFEIIAFCILYILFAFLMKLYSKKLKELKK